MNSKNISFEISNNIKLSGAISRELFQELTNRLTLDNPKYKEAEKYGRSTEDLSPTLKFYEAAPDDTLILPRGAARGIMSTVKTFGSVAVIDKRRELPTLDLAFDGKLRPYQRQAVGEILSKEFGVLESGTGSGKTVMALSIVATRNQPTLILVHTKELLYQWQDSIKTFIGIECGLVGAGKFDIQPVTVAIVNTARKRFSELVPHFGHLVVDECHRVPSTLFTETVTAFDTKYMLGLSATPYRRDGLAKLIGWYLGLYRVTVDAALLRDVGAILRPEIIQRETSFQYRYRDDYQPMISALVADPGRNNMIARDIHTQAEAGGLSLVVSDRVEHLKELATLADTDHEVLTGKTPPKKRREIVESLAGGQVSVLFSTLSLIGEGFDCPAMDSLFLATPIKFSGRLKQVVGRVLRPAEGKKPLVYDYQDVNVGVLEHQAKSRQSVYQSM